MAGAKETSTTPQQRKRAPKGRRTTGPVAVGGNNSVAGQENTSPQNKTGKKSKKSKGKRRGRGHDKMVPSEPAESVDPVKKTSRSEKR